MKRPSVYIETTIVSYLAARPSRNLLTAACQQATAQWWEDRRHHFDLFTSELVIEEARAGEPITAGKRLVFLEGVPAQADALHIAVAAVHDVDYLLTWNCRHIDNPSSKPAIRAVCEIKGYACPEICTAIEIMEVHQHAR